MSTQSSYVYDDHSGAKGLGRIALPPTMGNRFMPTIEEPALNYRRVLLPTQRKSRVRRITKPKSVLKPNPIIDRNPVPPPRPDITAIRNAALKKMRQTKKKNPAKPRKAKPPKVARKKTNAIAVQKKGEGKGILDGSISIGGYEVKKTRVAMAGGATAGSLLLLKLLL